MPGINGAARRLVKVMKPLSDRVMHYNSCSGTRSAGRLVKPKLSSGLRADAKGVSSNDDLPSEDFATLFRFSVCICRVPQQAV
jgi:hypothetical protein